MFFRQQSALAMSSTRPHPLLATVGVHLLRMGQAVGIASVGGLLVSTAKDLDFPLPMNKWALFFFAAGFLLGLPLSKTRLAPQNSRLLAIACCLGFMGAALLWGFSQNLPMYVAAFLLIGLMAAWQELAANPLMAELYPGNLSGALNIVHALYCLWAFLGPKGAGWWIGTGGSWRVIPLATLPIYALAIVCLALAGRHGEKKKPEALKTVAAEEPVAFQVPWLLVVLIVVYSGVSFTLNSWAPSILHEKFHLSDAEAASLIGGFYGLMLVGRLAWAWLSPRWGAVFLLGMTSLLSLFTNAGLMFSHTPQLAKASLWTTGMFIGSIVPLALAIEGERNPAAMKQITTWVFVGLGVGMLLGPPLAGVAAGAWGLQVILPASLALNVVMSGLGLWATLGRRKMAAQV